MNVLRGRSVLATVLLVLAVLVTACGPRGGQNRGNGDQLGGAVAIDGSSTVFPITEAVAEEFMLAHPGVQVTVGVSGTGGGFKKWVKGETDINNASRPITDSERKAAADNGLQPVEFAVAYDGLTVVVNQQAGFVDCLTVDELQRIWAPGSQVQRWSQVRPEWPDEPIRLYGPGTDSGTFEYFTETVVGQARASRPDYTASEDDNVLVQGVAGSRYALGYFGYAYYAENADRLKALAVDGGNGCVTPTDQTIEDGTYSPLSRPIFIYVSDTALQRPEVEAFVRFYLEHAAELVPAVGYTRLPAARYQEQLQKLAAAG